jgi:hypothetical protein
VTPVRFILFLIVIGFPVPVTGQVGMSGPRAAALGGAGTARAGETWAVSNAATWAAVTRPHVAVFATQAFGISELRFARSTVVVPVRRIALGGDIASFGGSDYRETAVAIIGAIPVAAGSRHLDVGVRAGTRTISITGFETATALHVDIGWIAELLPGLHIGGAIENLLEGGWSEVDRIPRVMRIGTAVSPLDGTLLVADLVKEDDYHWTGALGVEARLVPSFAIRFGGATSPDRLAVGAEVRVASLVLDVFADRHDELGWTPGLGITVRW